MTAKKKEPEHGEPTAASLAAIPELSRSAKQLDRARKDPQYTLALLREAQRITQVDVAHALKISQAQVSRIEHSIDDGDPQLSSLARYAEAIGGAIEIRVRIGDRSFRVSRDGRTFAVEGPSKRHVEHKIAEMKRAFPAAGSSSPAERKGPAVATASRPYKRPKVNR